MRSASLVSLGLILGLIFSALITTAWTGPTSAPPNGNVAAPINVGATDQTKNANLGVNGLSVFGNTILAGAGGSYLNFGATAGSSGYGIRDQSGTLEFKNSGGSWNNLTNTITNILGIGAVTQIKFSDGTTQTTAGGGSDTTMISGWPDAILCGHASYPDQKTLLPFAVQRGSTDSPPGAVLYGQNPWVQFNPDGSYNSGSLMTSAGPYPCMNKSISQLYASGQAFKLRGGP